MRNNIAYPTQQSSLPSRGIPCSHKRGMTTESQRYNCFTRKGGNAIPKHTSPEAKGNNPTTRLTLLWARNPFRGNFNHWQVSQKEVGQISLKIVTPHNLPQLHLHVETVPLCEHFLTSCI